MKYFKLATTELGKPRPFRMHDYASGPGQRVVCVAPSSEFSLAWHSSSRTGVEGLAPHCLGGAFVTHRAGHGRTGRGASHQEDSCCGQAGKHTAGMAGRQAGAQGWACL